ncbi:MAG: Holliday junction branch migration protein RuvA [Candidatus Latescibacterota bacterium]
MIDRIRGTLLAVEDDHTLVEVGGITYGILVSPATSEKITASGLIGQEVVLYTLHYIEGGIGMGALTPRLVGFISSNDRDFFTQLTSVQGLGVRKALRSMSIAAREYARAIELNDLMTLKKLPEIGNKTAQKIVMELRGKVTAFAHLREEEVVAAAHAPQMGSDYQEEAYQVLVQLQYTDMEARELVARAVQARPDITSSDALIQEIFRRQKT